ncbi:MAG: 23S rRNA (pseudouridine(1915)-N(3))-methyltransferase RlmH [Lachnospiraceae bacterium]|nr:23S rRNA (pseudouridine(1915)-N(3))-methyltransferase RlmH [Lachnospiraceae bacterium]MBR1522944.1 23S rRNA (pseudouridine(1915)-N(3))-methyltransferase RlmH [Lachnospiraceae bacterium]
MLRVTLISCGRLKERYLRDAVSEYKKRLSGYIYLTEKELDDGPDIKSEAARIIKAIPEGACIMTLEIEGREYTSEGFAEAIDGLMTGGVSHICFIIGGSEGLDKEIKDMAKMHVSFSRMTFPHQLMRVIFLEQLYRAFKIMKGEPYHK